MRRPELADTLTALALGACPEHETIVVEAAEISLPLVVRMERGPAGPRFFAQPPWSAFRSGFEPVAHRARLAFVSVPSGAPPARRPRTPKRNNWPARFPRGKRCPPAQAIR